MSSAKKKNLGGREYLVTGSTIEYGKGFSVLRKKYTTTKGTVVISHGRCTHPDGTISLE